MKIDSIIAEKPYTVIVGGAITGSENPNLVAKTIKSKMAQGGES